MAFIPTPNVAKAAITYSHSNGTEYTNTLWFEFQDFVASDMQVLGDYLRGWWETDILPNLQTSIGLDTVEVYDMQSVSGQKRTVLGTAATGGVTPEVTPANVALVITFNTDFRGRSGRGRNYVGGFSEGSVVENVIALTEAQAIADGYTNLRTGVGTTGWEWGIVSFQEGGVVRSQGEFRPITSAIFTRRVVASQRDRLP